jgi:hypothetical protein
MQCLGRKGKKRGVIRPEKATPALFLAAFARFSSESGKNHPYKPRLSPRKGLAKGR